MENAAEAYWGSQSQASLPHSHSVEETIDSNARVKSSNATRDQLMLTRHILRVIERITSMFRCIINHSLPHNRALQLHSAFFTSLPLSLSLSLLIFHCLNPNSIFSMTCTRRSWYPSHLLSQWKSRHISHTWSAIMQSVWRRRVSSWFPVCRLWIPHHSLNFSPCLSIPLVPIYIYIYISMHIYIYTSDASWTEMFTYVYIYMGPVYIPRSTSTSRIYLYLSPSLSLPLYLSLSISPSRIYFHIRIYLLIGFEFISMSISRIHLFLYL